jgi:hypothetical protein
MAVVNHHLPGEPLVRKDRGFDHAHIFVEAVVQREQIGCCEADVGNFRAIKIIRASSRRSRAPEVVDVETCETTLALLVRGAEERWGHCERMRGEQLR